MEKEAIRPFQRLLTERLDMLHNDGYIRVGSKTTMA